MATHKSTRRKAQSPATGYSDDTGPRIRAYLANVRPLRGCEDNSGDRRYQRGRSLIERMAISTVGTKPPTLKLSPAQCADVLYFMHYLEPVDDKRWFREPDDEPSHLVGQMLVLQALEAALRQLAVRRVS